MILQGLTEVLAELEQAHLALMNPLYYTRHYFAPCIVLRDAAGPHRGAG
jgi:hypothetical protein